MKGRFIQNLAARLYNYLEYMSMKEKELEYRNMFNIHQTARLGYLPLLFLREISLLELTHILI